MVLDAFGFGDGGGQASFLGYCAFCPEDAEEARFFDEAVLRLLEVGGRTPACLLMPVEAQLLVVWGSMERYLMRRFWVLLGVFGAVVAHVGQTVADSERHEVASTERFLEQFPQGKRCSGRLWG